MRSIGGAHERFSSADWNCIFPGLSGLRHAGREATVRAGAVPVNSGIAVGEAARGYARQVPCQGGLQQPAHWDGDRLYLFNSAPEPWRSSGNSVFDLGQAVLTRYQNKANGGRWIEATYKDDDGTLYGWYHNEPHPVCPAREALTAPRIGAALSHENVAKWQARAFVLQAP